MIEKNIFTSVLFRLNCQFIFKVLMLITSGTLLPKSFGQHFLCNIVPVGPMSCLQEFHVHFTLNVELYGTGNMVE